MIEVKIKEKTVEAIRILYGIEIEPSSIGLEKTRKEIPGDFTIVVFPFLKISRKSPEATANELGSYLINHLTEITEFFVIKGFLNLKISDYYWFNFLQNHYLDEYFGFKPAGNENPIVLEYSSPNTNKPLHLGHIRNNLLGFSLAEILKANGRNVIRVNLVNDRGIHICKSMLAYMKWGNGETPESTGIKGDHLIGKYYVLFDQKYKAEIAELLSIGKTQEEAERQAPLIIEAQNVLRKWEAGDNETLSLWRKMNDWALQGFDQTYQSLGVEFDKIYLESETYLSGKELVLEGLKDNAFFHKEDGSIWVDLREDGLDEKLLLRSDGTSVYITQDLGTAQLRFNDFHPYSMIYVVGNEQNYHFDVLKKVLAKLGREFAGHIYHLSYGMVELPQGKMKSREGTVVDADDLMDEMFRTAESTTRQLGKANELTEPDAEHLFRIIGLGALKYFILKVDPKKNMLFDPAESIDFNGNTGPFIQYTYARIQSLLLKGTNSGFDWRTTSLNINLPMDPLEREAIKRIYIFPEIVSEAGNEMSPATVANYLFDLAKGYNQLYQELPVLKEDRHEKVILRLIIASLTGSIIKKAMCLLGIEVPNKM